MKALIATGYTLAAVTALYGAFWTGWGPMFAIFAGVFLAEAASRWRDIWDQERWRWR